MKSVTKIYYLANKKTGQIIYTHTAAFFDAQNPDHPDETKMNLSEALLWEHLTQHRNFDQIQEIHQIKRLEDCHYQEMDEKDGDIQAGVFDKFSYSSESGKIVKKSEAEIKAQ